MFDVNNPQMPNFATMSESERRKYVHMMLTDENVRSKCVIMMGDKEQSQAIDINGLMKTVGPQKVEDLLVEVLGNTNTESAVMTENDVINMMERVENGTASAIEKQMADFVASAVSGEAKNRAIQVEGTSLTAHTILDILHFFKEKTGYNMEYIDILSAVSTLLIASTSVNDQNAMHRFKDTGPDHVMPMLGSVADDIAKRLEDSFGGKKPPDDILLLGLLMYAEKVAANFANGQKYWSKPKDIANFFGLDHSFKEAEEAANSPMGENGSNNGNEPNVCQPECFNPGNDKDESEND